MVKAGLDGEDHARLEWGRVPAHDVGIFVDVQPEPVPGLVAGERSKGRTLQNPKNQIVEIACRKSRAGGVAAGLVGLRYCLIERPIIITGLSDEESAREIGAIALHTRAEVDEQRVARLDTVVRARLRVRLGGVGTGSDDGRKRQAFRPGGE